MTDWDLFTEFFVGFIEHGATWMAYAFVPKCHDQGLQKQ